MGEVIGLIRVMPGEVLEDSQLEKMIEDIKAVIKPPAKVGNIEIKPVAFGLKGLNVTIVVPDDVGGLDPIAETISKVDNVESAEVTDVGRVWLFSFLQDLILFKYKSKNNVKIKNWSIKYLNYDRYKINYKRKLVGNMKKIIISMIIIGLLQGAMLQSICGKGEESIDVNYNSKDQLDGLKFYIDLLDMKFIRSITENLSYIIYIEWGI